MQLPFALWKAAYAYASMGTINESDRLRVFIGSAIPPSRNGNI
jgi:hypothetical protein